MADRIPWDEFEIKYAKLFPSDTGNVAKPLRMALGTLIIQTKFQYADRELVEQIAENPYLQYFIELPGYQEEAPFDASTLILFRKHISAEMLMELNERLLANKDDDNNGGTPSSSEDSNGNDESKEDKNEGTLTLDATCTPANIRYPQDVSLLNEARDIWYLDQFMGDGYAMADRDISLCLTIITLYGQQQYMYDNKTHSVEHRIVSISQPWLRPIIRGKTKTPIEFGAKFDLSLDSEGYMAVSKKYRLKHAMKAAA